ncbi:MAG: thiamine pyrophosphate-binding protein [Woeseiaceae bacterium]|nr:thiamine pyrophosphate-binding protein [Woeseiaceae bacterium]
MTDSKSGKDGNADLSRRAFLGTSAGAAAASLLGRPGASEASVEVRSGVPPQSAAALARDAGDLRPPPLARAVERPGSDLMVQVLRDLDIEYIAANPASSFEGLQESIVNFGDPPNYTPQFVSALHEESSVDMAHGYAKAEGRPMAVLLHSTLGLMHASMAIYQAYQYQVPIVMIAGRDDTNFHRAQTANDVAGIVRSITKWDAQPRSLPAALDAIQECYRQAVTPPCGPALVVIDTELQKMEAGDLEVPAFVPAKISGISRNQARSIARALLAANNPRIAVGRFRTPRGVSDAVTLAELVGASTSTRATMMPMSFPQRHPLCGPGFDQDYDYLIGLETAGVDAAIIGPHRRSLAGRDPTGIGYGLVREPPTPVWGPYAPPKPGNNDMLADAEASLPAIIAEVKSLLDRDKARQITARAEQHAAANHVAHVNGLQKAMQERRRGWNDSPISLARLFAELWLLIRDEDWCLASPTQFSSGHNRVLWDHNKPYSHLGMHGAGGIGYCIGASTGAALAAKSRNRIVINIQCDGDLNMVPGSLWTAAHYRLPMLVVMHNNRAWHQEYMYAQYMAGVRGRGGDRAHIGTTFRDPFIDYAKLGEAYGVESEGPIADPSKLMAALKRGVNTVKQGRPYLIDVLTQPR